MMIDTSTMTQEPQGKRVATFFAKRAIVVDPDKMSKWYETAEGARFAQSVAESQFEE